MKKDKRLGILVLICLIMFMLTACRSSEKKFEMTNYIGKTVDSLEKKIGLNLVNQGNGAYNIEDTMQVLVSQDNINSITLLKNAGEYTIFGVQIGMEQEQAKEKVSKQFEKEISTTESVDHGSVMYTYLDEDEELYVTYDTNTETVSEVSYFKLASSERTQAGNQGELMALIGDSRVYRNEVMVYLKSVQENYEAEYGNGLWSADITGEGKTFGALMKEEVMKQITQLKIIKAKAKEDGIALEEDEIAQANAYAKEHYEGLSDQDITRYLITLDLLQMVYQDNLLAEKVYENKTINADNNVSDVDSKQITVQHILINAVDYDSEGNAVPMETEDKDAAYEKVLSLWDEAKETDDFYSLAEENSETDDIEFTFGRGDGPEQYSSAFEQAAFTLKTGEVSDIITTDYGWHIIYCKSDFNEEATTQVKEEIIKKRRIKMFSDLYSQWSMDYDVIMNSEAWDQITFEEE